MEDFDDYHIIKPGKEEHNEAGKYRPISLINIGRKYWKNY